MKNFTKFLITLMVFSGMMFNLPAQTIKERIDEAKTVKVYFSISDIVHDPNTKGDPTNQASKGTGCVKFTQTTPFPANYTEEVIQIVEMLNKGFNTTAFVAGDISTVPLIESGILKGNQDWVKLGEPIVFVVGLGGKYQVTNMGLMGSVSLIAAMYINSSIAVYAPVSGKVKALSVKNLGSVAAPGKDTKTCPDYDYFVKNFPLADYFDKFKESFEKKTTDFITKEMSKKK
jgi:hypothetical protein